MACGDTQNGIVTYMDYGVSTNGYKGIYVFMNNGPNDFTWTKVGEFDDTAGILTCNSLDMKD